MGKPEDIPQDVWAAALAVSARATKGWQGSGPDSVTNLVSEVARAILAERTRCFRALLNTPEYQGRKNLVFRTSALDAIRMGDAA